MRTNLCLVLFTVFLICSIIPANAIQTGEFQKGTEMIDNKNLDKLSYLEQFKLSLKLPKLLKESNKLADESGLEILESQNQEIEQKNIKNSMDTFFTKIRAIKHTNLTQDITEDQITINAPTAAIKDANKVTKDMKNLIIENSTLLFANDVYDLKSGDIVQLYVENHFVYTSVLGQNTSQGNVLLRTSDRVVNMTLDKFKDSFTGLKMVSSNGEGFKQMEIIHKNQYRIYDDKIYAGKKLVSNSKILDGIAGVLGFSPLILDIFTLVYKIMKDPGNLGQYIGLLRNTITRAVKDRLKNVLKVMLWIVVILEIISAILLLVAVILRTIGEEKLETTQEDKNYLEHIYNHF